MNEDKAIAMGAQEMPIMNSQSGLIERKEANIEERQETKLEEIRGNEDRAVDHLHGIHGRLDDILSRGRGNAGEAATDKIEAPLTGIRAGIVFEIIRKQQNVWELIGLIESKITELEELL